MTLKKPNLTVYFTPSKREGLTRQVNYFDLIKRNSEEKKKEKFQKIYSLMGLGVGLTFIFLIFIYS